MRSSLYFIALALLPFLGKAQETPRNNTLNDMSLPQTTGFVKTTQAKPKHRLSAPPLEGPTPLLFVDSVQVENNADAIKSNDIVMVGILNPADAMKIIPTATGGLMYFEHKSFARKHYKRLFKSRSAIYTSLISSPVGDSNVQYIINGKVIKANVEGELAAINELNFQGLEIINKSALEKQYLVFDKAVGVAITKTLTN